MPAQRAGEEAALRADHEWGSAAGDLGTARGLDDGVSEIVHYRGERGVAGAVGGRPAAGFSGCAGDGSVRGGGDADPGAGSEARGEPWQRVTIWRTR